LTDEEIALKWWSGQASESPDWEFVSQTATVLSVDPEPVPVRPPSSERLAIESILAGKNKP
jgi:hypothetical protein